MKLKELFEEYKVDFPEWLDPDTELKEYETCTSTYGDNIHTFMFKDIYNRYLTKIMYDTETYIHEVYLINKPECPIFLKIMTKEYEMTT